MQNSPPKYAKQLGLSFVEIHDAKMQKITAEFLYRAGAETPKLSRKIPSFPRTILENFSGVDTQTAVLVSTAEVWISAPDTQTPIFLGFLGIHSWLWFFCRETKSFGYFPEVPVTKIRVSAPAPYKDPTVKRYSLNMIWWNVIRRDCMDTDKILSELRNARPATGIQKPEPRNSSKKTKKLTPGPRTQIP